jgi:two-component sensor histidine kinase
MLVIQDNGRGMSQPGEDQRPSSGAGGLGTKLVRQFVRQLGGSMTTKSDQGVRQEIVFEPYPSPAANLSDMGVASPP